MSADGKRRVVIVGGGFAGLGCAQRLAEHEDVEVTGMRSKLEAVIDWSRVVLGQLGRDLHHPLAVALHPRGPVRLLDRAAAGKRLGAASM